MTGPLSGVRVLDLTRVMAGPFCTQLLGDMGAEIIKVESVKNGDETRNWAPFWNEISCYFLSANRNKKSLAIDLKRPEGREIILKLARESDVFIENFRPGAIARLGLDYCTLSGINPKLVYVSMSGFGQDGPQASAPAYDLLMQAYSGLMSLTGTPEGSPVRTGLPVTDLAEALYAAFGIVSALFHGERTGEGQKVETSLLEGQIAWLSYYLVGYFANGIIPTGMGSAHHSLMPYKAYKAKDEYFVLTVGNDDLFAKLCQAIRRPDLSCDARFKTNVDRIANREALDDQLDKIFEKHTAAELVEWIKAAGVPCGLINTIDRVANDPQVKHLNMIQNVPHPLIPDLKLPGIPVRFSRTPGKIVSAPPALGQHTAQVLKDLGYSRDEMDLLRENRVIA